MAYNKVMQDRLGLRVHEHYIVGVESVDKAMASRTDKIDPNSKSIL